MTNLPGLHGLRVAYADSSPALRSWVDSQLGAPVVGHIPREGGMSPAVAASVQAADGSRAFVKAVSASVNPDTPNHFRHEIQVLSRLAPASYRAQLLGTYDDGDWVAILLEDIDGGHPNWDHPHHRAQVLETVQAQTRELTPAPELGVTSTALAAFDKYAATLQELSERELTVMPAWVAGQLDQLSELVASTRTGLTADSFCHWDIRQDNIVLRADTGQPVLVDWGMSRHGPVWGDVMCLGLEWVDTPYFDDLVGSCHLEADDERYVTGFLVALGIASAVTSLNPAPPGLPHMPAFRAQLARRTLEGVRRRLDL